MYNPLACMAKLCRDNHLSRDNFREIFFLISEKIFVPLQKHFSSCSFPRLRRYRQKVCRIVIKLDWCLLPVAAYTCKHFSWDWFLFAPSKIKKHDIFQPGLRGGTVLIYKRLKVSEEQEPWKQDLLEMLASSVQGTAADDNFRFERTKIQIHK